MLANANMFMAPSYMLPYNTYWVDRYKIKHSKWIVKDTATKGLQGRNKESENKNKSIRIGIKN